jgi:hypothetical protein
LFAACITVANQSDIHLMKPGQGRYVGPGSSLKGWCMFRQLLTNDIATIKRHIQSHAQGNGPMVVARIAGRADAPQVYDVREEELHPDRPTRQQQERRFLQELPLLPSPQKRLEVQIHPHRGASWPVAQALYRRSTREQTRRKREKIMCNKAPLQNLFDEGLAPLYEAIADLARRCRPGQPWALDLDNPIRWYVSKRLGWQAVATSAAYVFTEHHGALIMPNEWSLFLLSLQSHFKGLDRQPLIREIYEWTLTEKAQRLLRLRS